MAKCPHCGKTFPDAETEDDEEDEENTQSPWDVESIREHWQPNSIRLPDTLHRWFNAYYGRLDSELTMHGIDRQFRKDRHYKPLIISLGISTIDEMDVDEIIDTLDELEQHGHLMD